MTDLRLDSCAAPVDDWEAAPRRSVDVAEAVERATSSRIFFVRLVARALLAFEAAVVPTRRGALSASRGILRLAAFTSVSAARLRPGPARLVSSVRRRVSLQPAPAPRERGSSQTTALVNSSTSAVLAELIWRGRSLLASLAEVRRAPATLAKAALASSMTITILGGTAAAAVRAGDVSGGARSAMPRTGVSGGSVTSGAAPGTEAGHRAVASSATAGGAPGMSPPAAAPATTGPPIVPKLRGALPPGKGMWLFEPDKSEGGNVGAIVSKASAVGLNYLYVHLGSSTGGFFGQPFLDQLLPAAHSAHIRVYGWDFPYFRPPEADVWRAVAEINYRTPSGDRIDGFAADIEPEPGVNLSQGTASTYSGGLRAAVGPNYPLIGVVPRPNGSAYPFSGVLSHFDAVAVMDYWLNREPGADIAGADASLSGQNLSMIPIGQAYDGAENGVPGTPSAAAIQRFMQAAEQTGAAGASFWSWQGASQDIWNAIRGAPQFSLPTAPAPMTPGQIRTWQVLLSSLGFPVWPTGVWDQSTTTAVSNYQHAANLPVSGVIDQATKAVMLTPFPPPIQPAGQLPAVPTPPPAPPLPTEPNPFLPFLYGSQGMGTPTSAPVPH